MLCYIDGSRNKKEKRGAKHNRRNNSRRHKGPLRHRSSADDKKQHSRLTMACPMQQTQAEENSVLAVYDAFYFFDNLARGEMRLNEKVGRPQAHSLFYVFALSEVRQNNNRRICALRLGLQLPQDFKPVNSRQDKIEQNKRRSCFFRALQRFFPVYGLINRKSLALQLLYHKIPKEFVVLHD